METDASTYTLNAWQFEQALAILQREQQANTPSPRQENIFKFLNISIYGFGIAYLASFLLLFVHSLFGLNSIVHDKSETFDVLFAIDNIALFISATAITLLFFLSLPYVRRLLQRRKLARQLGLWEALHIPWKTERRQNKLRNVSDVGILILGFIMIGSSFVFFPMIGVKGLLFFVFFFVVGGAIIVTLSVRRSKERLGLIARLYSSLERYKDEVKQDKDSPIHIPAEAYEKIAEIERAQIARDRVQSIQGNLGKAGASPYVLQKSHTAQQAQARLDATTRVRVEDQIDALITEPHPPGITADPKAGAFDLRVPETSVIIRCTVDDQAHRIQILSVESTSNAAESSSEPGK